MYQKCKALTITGIYFDMYVPIAHCNYIVHSSETLLNDIENNSLWSGLCGAL